MEVRSRFARIFRSVLFSTGTLSGLNLVRKYTDVGLSGIVELISSKYSEFVSFVAWLISLLLGLAVPNWFMDTAVLYAFLLGVSYRCTSKYTFRNKGIFWRDLEKKYAKSKPLRHFYRKAKMWLPVLFLAPLLSIKPIRLLIKSYKSDLVRDKWRDVQFSIELNDSGVEELTRLRMRQRAGWAETFDMISVPVSVATLVLIGTFNPI